MVDVIGLGAGGHAKAVVESLGLAGGFNIVGLLDANKCLQGTCVLNVPVLGGDELLDDFRKKGIRHAFLGVGGAPSTRIRSLLFKHLLDVGFDVIHAIHPRAFIAPSVRVGTGLTAMAEAVIHTEAVIGDNVIVNTSAVVEHDCVIGDHVHVASAAVLAGGVVVGERAFVGAAATVHPQVRIGPRAIVGAGAVVVRDVPADAVVVGVPARILRLQEAA